MSTTELNARLLEASSNLQALVDAQPQLVHTEVEANKLAKLAEATTLTTLLADDRLNGVKRTVPEYTALVDKACLDERYKADLAEGLRKSNELAIRAAMSKLSAMQSVASALREEMRFSRTGPEMAP